MSKEQARRVNRKKHLWSVPLAAALALPAWNAPLEGPGRDRALPTQHNSTHPKSAGQKSAASYGELPLRFEENLGQTDSQVKFLARGGGATLFLTPTSAVLTLNAPAPKTAQEDPIASRGSERAAKTSRAVLWMKLAGANPEAELVGIDPMPGKSHYFIGRAREKWQTNVPNYAKVRYREVYPGVDLLYYGNGRQLEYDFQLAPGADPGRISLAFEGAEKMWLEESGDLVLRIAEGEIRQRKPVVYQEVDGVRQAIGGRYRLKGRGRVGFQIARYDAKKPLVIDPMLTYSSYLGGGLDEVGNAIAVDSSGNAFVTGETASIDFPATPGAIQIENRGETDAFVAMVNPEGTALLYATYLGGTLSDRGNAIAVDSSGTAYVAGRVSSTDFPTTPGAFQPSFRGGAFDAFVTSLSPDGSALLYSTYLGGADNDAVFGIAVDFSGNAFVTGGTASQKDFPTTIGTFQPFYGGGRNDAFVTALDAAGSAAIYSSFLGGSFIERGNGIALDAEGNAIVTGWTDSLDFRLESPFQAQTGGGRDAFVAKVIPDGSALIYSTFLGGTGEDAGLGIAADSSGSAYVTGYTDSTDFPMESAWQPSNGGGQDGFVTKFNALGTALLYSTYLGGSNHENLVAAAAITGGISVDASGNAHVIGVTRSSDFPTQNPVQPSFGGGIDDAFVTKFDAQGSAVIYSTFLGGSLSDIGTGIAVDLSGNAYVAGETRSEDFPTASPFQPSSGGGADAFVARITDTMMLADLSTSSSDEPDPVMPGSDITYMILVANSGPNAAESLLLTNDLPPETTFQSLEAPPGWACETPPVGSPGTVTCTALSLPAKSADTFTLIVKVNEGVEEGTELTNATSVSAVTSDPDPANNLATATTTVSSF